MNRLAIAVLVVAGMLVVLPMTASAKLTGSKISIQVRTAGSSVT